MGLKRRERVLVSWMGWDVLVSKRSDWSAFGKEREGEECADNFNVLCSDFLDGAVWEDCGGVGKEDDFVFEYV